MTTLLERFQRLAQYETATIDRFKKELDKDPAYALSWGCEVFAAAAKLRILKQLINALEDEQTTTENIRDHLMGHIMHKSRYPAQSTSPTSNLIEQYELAACARIVGDLPRYKFDN
jgi:hypothetical protein